MSAGQESEIKSESDNEVDHQDPNAHYEGQHTDVAMPDWASVFRGSPRRGGLSVADLLGSQLTLIGHTTKCSGAPCIGQTKPRCRSEGLDLSKVKSHRLGASSSEKANRAIRSDSSKMAVRDYVFSGSTSPSSSGSAILAMRRSGRIPSSRPWRIPI